MPVIPALGKPRHKDGKFEASLKCISRPHLKKKTQLNKLHSHRIHTIPTFLLLFANTISHQQIRMKLCTEFSHPALVPWHPARSSSHVTHCIRVFFQSVPAFQFLHGKDGSSRSLLVTSLGSHLCPTHLTYTHHPTVLMLQSEGNLQELVFSFPRVDQGDELGLSDSMASCWDCWATLPALI